MYTQSNFLKYIYREKSRSGVVQTDEEGRRPFWAESSPIELFPKSQMLVTEIESTGEPEALPGLSPTYELHSGCYF